MPLPRRTAAAIALVAAAMLTAAFAFEAFAGLRPCELCWWQRWAWLAALPPAIAAAIAPPRLAAPLLLVAALAVLAGAGSALFHVGVEQHWWRGTAACGSDGPATTPEELLRRLLGQPVARCDEVVWSLAGISMAGWNLAISLVAGLAAAAVALRGRRGRPA
jgi:disulfide bond formation protein DsbB